MADFFCLDLGETQIRLSDIKPKGNFFEATGLSLIDMDPLFYRTESENIIEKTASSISKVLDQLKIKKKAVRVIIPDTFSYNRFIEMPKLKEKELLSAIRYQADQFIPMPIDNVNLDIEVVNENMKTNKTLVLLSASPKNTVEKVKKVLEYTGLFPESIEPETSSIARLLSQIFNKQAAKSGQQSQNTGFILINLNMSSTSIYYFDRTLKLMTHSSNFNSGYNIFLKEIQVNLNVDIKKAADLLKSFGVAQNTSYHLEAFLAPSLKDILDKIDRSIKEIVNTNKSLVSNIYLTNEAFKFHSLDSIIGKFFAIPTGFFDPLPYFVKNKIVDFFKNDLTYFMASMGGSLR